MTHAWEIDAAGLLCPLPVLKTAKKMRNLLEGQTVLLRTDDPAAVIDVPHFCQEQNHVLVSSEMEDGVQVYVIRHGGGHKKAG